MFISTVRAGLMVYLHTTVRGNVKHFRRVVDKEVTDSGAEIERAETERTVYDPIELDRAKKARGKASSLIRGVCAKSEFMGLVCPEAKADELEKAIVEARDVVDRFNSEASFTHINVYVSVGRVEQDDVKAVRAISAEMSSLLAKMERGVKAMDPEAIREAANKARDVGQMLSPEANERVKDAIAAARRAARNIVKAGEVAAVAIDEKAIKEITAARTSFLDLDECEEIAAPEMAGRGLDLMPTDSPEEMEPDPVDEIEAPAITSRQLEY